ncbi:MAG: SurA N-terminal domain-containing protein [Pseudomonadota bacterium]|nr:SurA N-terminal domain-containing protein [Pseudomonadota bacterium]
MFAAFRRLSKSAVGTIIMVLFLLAIVASFALADLSNVGSGTLGGSRAGTLAEVGNEEVTDRDLDRAMQRLLQQAQQQNPGATYATIAGQLDNVLDQLINQATLLAFAADHGFVLSKRLVDAEIAGLPQTRGLDGKFNEQAYAAFLQEQRLSDAELRRLLGGALTERLVIAPAAADARVPLGMARTYASMLLEQREGQFALVPADAFRTGLNPSAGDLQSFYAQNRQRYMVPEQRVLKIARISPDTVANVAQTEAEIAAYYNANRATYAGSETRVISQAVVPDKRQADGIAARARSGAAFAAAAAPAGFAAADVNLGPQSRAQFIGAANEAIANAAFSAARGAVIGPIRSDLGWHVIKVEDIRGASGRTLAQARGEIAELLTANKRKEALADLVTRVEEQILDRGASFAETVAAAKLPVTTTPPIISSGASRVDAAYRFPAELQPALQAAFAMEAGADAEVVTLPNEAGYALVAVDQVIEAAPAPLAQITDRVRADWIQRKANDRARAVATDIANKVARGVPIERAVSEAGVSLPPAQPVAARRIQISQANAAAAAPLRMLFALAQGRSRLVADPQGRGYFIVKTNKITPGNALSNPMLIAQTQSEFQQAVGSELAQQMAAAMKVDQGIERNEKAIAATKQRFSSSQ